MPGTAYRSGIAPGCAVSFLVSRTWRIRHHSANNGEIPPRSVRTYISVGSHFSLQRLTLRPATIQSVSLSVHCRWSHEPPHSYDYVLAVDGVAVVESHDNEPTRVLVRFTRSHLQFGLRAAHWSRGTTQALPCGCPARTAPAMPQGGRNPASVRRSGGLESHLPHPQRP